jgi:hypothetical protein
MTATLKSSDGQMFTWAAIGRWEQVRCLREKALEFCWESNLEDAYEFRCNWLEGGNWDDLETLSWDLDDRELDVIIKQVLDYDERMDTMTPQKKSAFYAVLEHYGYSWNEDVSCPANHPEGNTLFTWVVRRKR